jgi:hypothetical protein
MLSETKTTGTSARTRVTRGAVGSDQLIRKRALLCESEILAKISAASHLSA